MPIQKSKNLKNLEKGYKVAKGDPEMNPLWSIWLAEVTSNSLDPSLTHTNILGEISTIFLENNPMGDRNSCNQQGGDLEPFDSLLKEKEIL